MNNPLLAILFKNLSTNNNNLRGYKKTFMWNETKRTSKAYL